MKISIIGQGYVGLPLGLAAAQAGFEVLGFDINKEVVQRLNQGQSHIEDINQKELNKVIESGHYRATSSEQEIEGSEVVIIAVPTPLDSNRNPDLSHVIEASQTIGKNIKTKVLVINESTSYPGTLRNLIAPTIKESSEFEGDHLYAITPERVDPGNKEWKISNTPRLFAGLNSEAAIKFKEVYGKFCSSLIEVSSPEVAEAAKLFENTFRQVNIALVNEFAQITEKLGISAFETLNAASSKPYGFMKFTPSIGVGGHCIPVDPIYLLDAARKNGADSKFIELANNINHQMSLRVINMIENKIESKISGKKVVIYGLSYKRNISDLRESPSIELINLLRSKGAKVSWVDPIVGSWNGEQSLVEAKDFQIAILAVNHDIFTTKEIHESAMSIFDATGSLPGAFSF